MSTRLGGSLDTLKQWATDLGGECLSEKYDKAKDKYHWKCAKGHMWWAQWNNIRWGGQWCRICRSGWHETDAERALARKEAALRFARKPESKIKAKNRYQRFKEERPGYVRGRCLAKYGLTEETWANKIESQGGLCALCLRRLPDSRRDIVVDHCHRTGAMRGIIHRRCNSAIGFLEDSPQLLDLARKYLENHDATTMVSR